MLWLLIPHYHLKWSHWWTPESGCKILHPFLQQLPLLLRSITLTTSAKAVTLLCLLVWCRKPKVPWLLQCPWVNHSSICWWERHPSTHLKEQESRARIEGTGNGSSRGWVTEERGLQFHPQLWDPWILVIVFTAPWYMLPQPLRYRALLLQGVPLSWRLR